MTFEDKTDRELLDHYRSVQNDNHMPRVDRAEKLTEIEREMDRRGIYQESESGWSLPGGGAKTPEIVEHDLNLREGQWNYIGQKSDSASTIRRNGGWWMKPEDNHYKIVGAAESEEPGTYIVRYVEYPKADFIDTLEELPRENLDRQSMRKQLNWMRDNTENVPVRDMTTDYWGYLQDNFGISSP